MSDSSLWLHSNPSQVSSYWLVRSYLVTLDFTHRPNDSDWFRNSTNNTPLHATMQGITRCFGMELLHGITGQILQNSSCLIMWISSLIISASIRIYRCIYYHQMTSSIFLISGQTNRMTFRRDLFSTLTLILDLFHIHFFIVNPIFNKDHSLIDYPCKINVSQSQII